MSEVFDAGKWRPGPLLPGHDERDASLVFVVGVLCFLACLTAIAALGADRAARGWTSQLRDSATIVVRPKGQETPDGAAAKAAEALAGVKGVTEARAIEADKARALLEPWLGTDALPEDLPVPRLVAVDLDRDAPATAAQLSSALGAAGVDATVDDHSRWIGDIEHGAGLARLACLAVFALIACAATAVIAFATRAGLAARHEVIEVLHLSGAQPGFIARLFQGRFARMAALAGVLGAGAAAVVGAAVRLAGGGAGLTPVLPIVWTDLLYVLLCPPLAALVAGTAARIVATRRLRALAE